MDSLFVDGRPRLDLPVYPSYDTGKTMPSQETNFAAFCEKKAFEIAYAVFRISEYVKQKSFADYLETYSLSILEAASTGKYQQLLESAKPLENLLRLGGESGFIKRNHADIVIMEVMKLTEAVNRQMAESHPAEPELDIERIFSKQEYTPRNRKPATEKKPAIQQPAKDEPAEDLKEEEMTESEKNAAKIRQSVILEKIRQTGNCRLKDIDDILPDLSERTIRYDIQQLIEKNLIERIGAGPNVVYRLRNFAEA